jgi:hypothetical protein
LEIVDTVDVFKFVAPGEIMVARVAVVRYPYGIPQRVIYVLIVLGYRVFYLKPEIEVGLFLGNPNLYVGFLAGNDT